MQPWSDPEATDQVGEFYDGLDERDADSFDAAVERLTEVGPTLGRPTVDVIDLAGYGQEIRNLFGSHLKELRPTSSMRILFIFGPDRVPVLLYAGDKVGEWNAWYPPAIREAARLYRDYLKDIA